MKSRQRLSEMDVRPPGPTMDETDQWLGFLIGGIIVMSWKVQIKLVIDVEFGRG